MKLIRMGMALAAVMLLSACGSGEGETAPSGTVATAQQSQSVGSMTGTIDGKEVALNVLGPQSDYGNTHISLYVLGEGLRARGLGSLMLGAEMLGAEWTGEHDGNVFSADVTIAIPETKPVRVYYGSLEDGLSLTITNSSLDGEALKVSGRVKGTLIAMDLAAYRNPDPGDTLDVDLSFDAALDKL